MNNTYTIFSNIGFLSKNYSLKFLFIAFLGVHIPLIAIIFSVTFNWFVLGKLSIVLVTLLFTLIAALCTLFLLNELLWPIKIAKSALEKYINFSVLPDLPTGFKDEAGILLQQTQYTITELDIAIKDKEDLISICSHDLKLPSALQIVYADLILKSNNIDFVHEFANDIKETSKKQLALINDIVDLLKLKSFSNIIANDFKDISLKEFLLHLKNDYILSAQNKKIELILKETDFEDIHFKGEKRLITQAIGNIVSNAIKFSHPNTYVVITAEIISDFRFQITIADCGVGMQAEQMALLFKKFVKGKTGTDGETSTGLGLYLAKNYIEMHNGNITVNSKGLNNGSVFSIELPYNN